VHGRGARRLDREAEQRVGVGQQVAHGRKLRLDQPLGRRGIAVRGLGAIGGERRERSRPQRGARGIGGVRPRRGRVEEHPGAGVVQHEVVQHQQARQAGQQRIQEGMGGAVAHLIDRQVEGVLAVPVEEGRRARHAAGVREPLGLDGLLIVEDLDLVPSRQQGQHVGRVVGDPARRGRERAQERKPHRRAISAYSWGP
jgi:hypothetical protein